MSKEPRLGLVMVKPHALEQASIVSEILNGDNAAAQLGNDDPLTTYLDRIDTGTTIIRDLRACNIAASLLNIFYEDKRDRRYFPLIIERYLGKAAFLPYAFRGYTEELPGLYNAMKGTSETFDAEGKTVSRARGIRGVLSSPYLAVDSSTLLLDDETYRVRCLPMIDNFIHVCDSPQQNRHALQVLGLSADQISC